MCTTALCLLSQVTMIYYLRTINCSPAPLQVEQIRADIRDFCRSSGVDKVIVLWTANTERFCDITPGVNDTAQNLLAAIQVREGFNGGQKVLQVLSRAHIGKGFVQMS